MRQMRNRMVGRCGLATLAAAALAAALAQGIAVAQDVPPPPPAVAPGLVPAGTPGPEGVIPPAVVPALPPVEGAAPTSGAARAAAPAARTGPVKVVDGKPTNGKTKDVVDIGAEAPSTVKGQVVSKTAAGEELISVTLNDVPLQDVVNLFVRLTGANIIATATNLQGNVTVNLENVEWKPALQAILDVHSLVLMEKPQGSGVYTIVRRAPGAPEPLLVEIVRLKYATTPSVRDAVAPLLVPGGSVQPFIERNVLILRSTAQNLTELKRIIEQIDQPRDQVYIEAKFCELDDGAIKDLGINWKSLADFQVDVATPKWEYKEDRTTTKSDVSKFDRQDNRNTMDVLTKEYDKDGVLLDTSGRKVTDTINPVQNTTRLVTDEFKNIITDVRSATVLSHSDFQFILSALKQMSGASIVSNPKVIVANSEPARIHIGETRRPFISTVSTSTEGQPVISYNPGDPIQVGVIVTVTPTINTDSNITVKIEPQITRLLPEDQWEIAPNGQTYPVVSTKTIRTVFGLSNGQTAAIGGLTQSSQKDTSSSIPLLGDIPIVGKYLFSHTHKEKAQDETIIFVTVGLANPREIGTDGKSLLPMEADLVHKSLLESEMARKARDEKLRKVQEAKSADESWGERMNKRWLRLW